MSKNLIYTLLGCGVCSIGLLACDDVDTNTPNEMMIAATANVPLSGMMNTATGGMGTSMMPGVGATGGMATGIMGGTMGGMMSGGMSLPPSSRMISSATVQQVLRDNLASIERKWTTECAVCDGLTGQELIECAEGDYEYSQDVGTCLFQSALSDADLQIILDSFICEKNLVDGLSACHTTEGVMCETFQTECNQAYAQNQTCSANYSETMYQILTECYNTALCSDEPTECFTCMNGEQVLAESVCDSYPDCSDGSDEPDDCPSFTCVDRSNSIPLQWQCDGFPDCMDESDEMNCEG